mmetsp:Transcript_18006/g.56484  ORF Transcript_18006/g.56484 Transcript_18006/m.56484 type:complete len:341 (-) Transcript_18006:3471-4493(-)
MRSETSWADLPARPGEAPLAMTLDLSPERKARSLSRTPSRNGSGVSTTRRRPDLASFSAVTTYLFDESEYFFVFWLVAGGAPRSARPVAMATRPEVDCVRFMPPPPPPLEGSEGGASRSAVIVLLRCTKRASWSGGAAAAAPESPTNSAALAGASELSLASTRSVKEVTGVGGGVGGVRLAWEGTGETSPLCAAAAPEAPVAGPLAPSLRFGRPLRRRSMSCVMGTRTERGASSSLTRSSTVSPGTAEVPRDQRSMMETTAMTSSRWTFPRRRRRSQVASSRTSSRASEATTSASSARARSVLTWCAAAAYLSACRSKEAPFSRSAASRRQTAAASASGR